MNVTSQGYFTTQYLDNNVRLPRQNHHDDHDEVYYDHQYSREPLWEHRQQPMALWDRPHQRMALWDRPQHRVVSNNSDYSELAPPAIARPETPQLTAAPSFHTTTTLPPVLRHLTVPPSPKLVAVPSVPVLPQQKPAYMPAYSPEVHNYRRGRRGPRKVRNRQQLAVSNIQDPDYLEMGITPADLHYLDGRGAYEREQELDQSNHRIRDPFKERDEEFYGYGSLRLASGPGLQHNHPASRRDVLEPIKGYYINQKQRYDAANEMKPTMYTHKTLREVFQNRQEQHTHYNPMEFVFDQKQDGKVKRAMDTFKVKMGKDNYKDYDYFEMKKAQIRKLDEAAAAAAAAAASLEAVKDELPEYVDAPSRVRTPSPEPHDSPQQHVTAAAADTIYSSEPKPKANKFFTMLKKARLEGTLWDLEPKKIVDEVFEQDVASPVTKSHTPVSAVFVDLPESATKNAEADVRSEPLASSPAPSSPTHTVALSAITRPDLESIYTEYTTTSTVDQTTIVPVSPSLASSPQLSDSSDPVEDLSEPSSVTEQVFAPVAAKPQYKVIMAGWPKQTLWGGVEAEPAPPKVKKPLFSGLRNGYKTRINSKWNQPPAGGGGGGAPLIRLVVPLVHLAVPLVKGLVRLVRTKGALTVVTMDVDHHSEVSRELVMNPVTHELEPPTSASLMMVDGEPAAPPAHGGGGGGGFLAPVYAKFPALEGHVTTLASYGGKVVPMVGTVTPYVAQAHPTNFTNRLRLFEFIQMVFRPLDDIAAKYPLLTLPIHILEVFFFLWLMWEALKLLDILYKILKVIFLPFHVLGQSIYKA